MSRNKSIQISVILILSLFLTSFTVIDGINSAGSHEDAAPWMPVTNTPTETAIPAFTDTPTDIPSPTSTEEPTHTETPDSTATPTGTPIVTISETPTETEISTETQTPVATETPTVSPTSTTTYPVVGPGIYDDTNTNIIYSSGWSPYTITGDYNSTDHFSSVVGSTATLSFQLESPGTVSILYRANNVTEVMDITIDGSPVATINQYSSAQTYQCRWDSNELNTGIHTIILTHSSGQYITLDAISVNVPVGQNVYDDTHPNIFFGPGWSDGYTWAGNYLDTEHHSAIAGSSAYLTFHLDQPGIVSIIYRMNNVCGNMDVSIDGDSRGLIYQNTGSEDIIYYQQRWDDPNTLEAGEMYRILCKWEFLLSIFIKIYFQLI